MELGEHALTTIQFGNTPSIDSLAKVLPNTKYMETPGQGDQLELHSLGKRLPSHRGLGRGTLDKRYPWKLGRGTLDKRFFSSCHICHSRWCRILQQCAEVRPLDAKAPMSWVWLPKAYLQESGMPTREKCENPQGWVAGLGVCHPSTSSPCWKEPSSFLCAWGVQCFGERWQPAHFSYWFLGEFLLLKTGFQNQL